MQQLFSIIESPLHPDMAALYTRLGLQETRLTSVRKAIQALKTNVPAVVVADFVYGYGNNYAGINVCNLDVFLHSLQKYTTDYQLIILVEKEERQYVDRLAALFPIDQVLCYPVDEAEMQSALQPG